MPAERGLARPLRLADGGQGRRHGSGAGRIHRLARKAQQVGGRGDHGAGAGQGVEARPAWHVRTLAVASRQALEA